MQLSPYMRALSVVEGAMFEGGGARWLADDVFVQLERAAGFGRVEDAIERSIEMFGRARSAGLADGQLFDDAQRMAANVLAVSRGTRAPLTHESQLLGRVSASFDHATAAAYLRSAPG